MATTTLEPQAGAPSAYRRSWVIDWLTTVDHKKIGVLYIVNSFLFFFGAMLRGLAQVQHGLDAVLLELPEVLDAGLSAGAELGRHLQEVANRRDISLRGRGRLRPWPASTRCT